MIDSKKLVHDLARAGFEDWATHLTPLLDAKLSPGAHGDYTKWAATIDSLPAIPGVNVVLDADIVGGACVELTNDQCEHLRTTLLNLSPWRKGPFNLCGVAIDSEWRSDLKWRRLANHIAPLAGRNVLDVGCGNGYYALRMRGEGASFVMGIDPTLLFVFQFIAIARLLSVENVHVLPLRLHELPPPPRGFDSAFSMGVLYHQREPLEHLAQLRGTLRPGGELILETLVWPGDEHVVHVPERRYARMRNVWHLPTVAALNDWLTRSGFVNTRVVDVTLTSINEQRSTDWMTFESLADALDPNNSALTVEGLPAPTRAVLVCNKASS